MAYQAITNHSFVVRIWLEEPAGDNGEIKWRGHITHFPSMLDKYFDDLEDLNNFIRSCLKLNYNDDKQLERT